MGEEAQTLEERVRHLEDGLQDLLFRYEALELVVEEISMSFWSKRQIALRAAYLSSVVKDPNIRLRRPTDEIPMSKFGVLQKRGVIEKLEVLHADMAERLACWRELGRPPNQEAALRSPYRSRWRRVWAWIWFHKGG